MAGHGFMAEVESWFRSGAELKTKLIERKRELLQELRDVDRALAAIPEATPIAGPAAEHGGTDDVPRLDINWPSKPLSAINTVRVILAHAHPNGLTTGEITEITKQSREIPAKLVAHAVHELMRRNEVVVLAERSTGKSKRVYGLAMPTQPDESGAVDQSEMPAKSSIPEMAAEALRTAHAPLSAADVYHRLVEMGWRAPKSGREVVRSALNRRSDLFYRVHSGLYALTAWHTGPIPGVRVEEVMHS